jgi:hypothetical protein
MPKIDIQRRNTDIKIVYNKNRTRLDRIAGDVYGEEEYWRIIMWANPEFEFEFEIPDDTLLRVPLPKSEVENEIIRKITNNRNR